MHWITSWKDPFVAIRYILGCFRSMTERLGQCIRSRNKAVRALPLAWMIDEQIVWTNYFTEQIWVIHVTKINHEPTLPAAQIVSHMTNSLDSVTSDLGKVCKYAINVYFPNRSSSQKWQHHLIHGYHNKSAQYMMVSDITHLVLNKTTLKWLSVTLWIGWLNFKKHHEKQQTEQSISSSTARCES